MIRNWQFIGVTAYWLTLPALKWYLGRSKRTRLLLVSEGKVLCVKPWLSSGKWMLPGGGLEQGETPRDGAVRELREETGIEVNPDALTDLGNHTFNHHGIRFGYVAFLADLATAQVPAIKGIEISEAGWIDPAELTPANASPDVLNLLAAWRSLR